MTPQLRLAIEERLKEFEPALTPEEIREMLNGPRLHAALVVAGNEYAREADIDARDVFHSCDSALRAVGWQSFYSTRGLDEKDLLRFHAIARGETPVD